MARGAIKDPIGSNRLEREYAAHLEKARLLGKIIGWWHEPTKFKIGHRCWYTPDFMIQLLSGEIVYHETKGFMRDDALVKLKAVAELYPYRFIVVRRVKAGGWKFEQVKTSRTYADKDQN